MNFHNRVEELLPSNLTNRHNSQICPSNSSKNPKDCLCNPGSGDLNGCACVACCQLGPQNIWLLQLGHKNNNMEVAGGSFAAH